ncbi:hypothetical protein ABPG72_020848 [Tetrahymena utriculariae]
MLVIQMPDVFNSFNSYNILNTKIKPQNFFTNLKGIIRHCCLGFASAFSQSQSYNKSMKLTQFYFGPQIERRFSIVLELDKVIILCRYWIQQGIIKMYQGKGIFTKFKYQINKKFNTFQIVEVILDPKYQQRKPPPDLIKYLMRKQKNEPNLLVYLAILPDMVKQQAKIIRQSSLKKQANQSIYLEQNELMQLFQQLFHNKCYNKSFEIIFCSYGIVKATKNKKRLQEVYEFDRFSCSLKKYLQKSFNVIYNYLMTDNFLILFQDNKIIAIKFCHFGLSYYLNGNKLLIRQKYQGICILDLCGSKQQQNIIYSRKIHALTLKDQNSRMFTLNHQQTFYQITQISRINQVNQAK